MPIYVIERRFAEQIDVSVEDVKEIEAVNADENVQWIFSFLTVDRMRTYCLYEAPSPDALRAAARRLNIPADAIVEVSQVSADSIRTQAATV
jgi:Nickel responsive protein SCO4226-like